MGHRDPCRRPARDLRPARLLDRAQLRRPADDGGGRGAARARPAGGSPRPGDLHPTVLGRRPRRRRPQGGVLLLRGRGDPDAHRPQRPRTHPARDPRGGGRRPRRRAARRTHRLSLLRRTASATRTWRWRSRLRRSTPCGSRPSSSSAPCRRSSGAGEIELYKQALGDLFTLEVVPGGHSVLWDAFDETAAAIDAFLEGLENPSRRGRSRRARRRAGRSRSRGRGSGSPRRRPWSRGRPTRRPAPWRGALPDRKGRRARACPLPERRRGRPRPCRGRRGRMPHLPRARVPRGRRARHRAGPGRSWCRRTRPSRRTSSRSPSSRERTPMRKTCSGFTAGSGHASLPKASSASPSAAARGIPWTFPLGEVSGVFRSPCASNQSTPPAPWVAASPPSVPSAIEWSPPRTIGTEPSLATAATRRAMRSQAFLISVRKRALGSPDAVASGTTVSTLPQSEHSSPRRARRSSRPA